MVKVLYRIILLMVCHISGVLHFDDDKILNGKPVEITKFPYQVSLQWSDSKKHFCGGSIIGKRHILTAAHCIKNNRNENVAAELISVVAGQNVLTINQNTVIRYASRVYIHEEFDNSTKQNDIAIIEVSEAFPLGVNINIADMRRDKIKPGTKCTISGWGVQKRENTQPNAKLLVEEIEVMDFNQCRDKFARANKSLLPGMMCAWVPDGSTDSTKGDSGGPLFCNYFLTGIISTGKKFEGIVYPGVYTEVAHYLQWIKNKIELSVLSLDDDRIVGGRPAEEAEFPYQVSIRRSFNDRHFCGGSIIGPRHILTAAHCMKYVWGGNLPAIVVSIVAGQNNLTIHENTVIRNASMIYIHEEFDNNIKKNDIAVIEVAETFPFNNYHIAIVDMRHNAIKPGSKCIVSGWGVQEFGLEEPNEDLLAAEIKVIDFNHCQDLYSKVDVLLSPGMMCAGLQDGSKDACQGDSGGPLFCNGLLTGIVSTAIGCANAEFPGIYTQISDYIPWITNILNKNKGW